MLLAPKMANDYNLGGSNALYSLPFVANLQHSPNKNQYNFRNFQEKSAQLAYSIFKKIFILRSGNFLTAVDSFFADRFFDLTSREK